MSVRAVIDMKNVPVTRDWVRWRAGTRLPGGTMRLGNVDDGNLGRCRGAVMHIRDDNLERCRGEAQQHHYGRQPPKHRFSRTASTHHVEESLEDNGNGLAAYVAAQDIMLDPTQIRNCEL